MHVLTLKTKLIAQYAVRVNSEKKNSCFVEIQLIR